MRWLCLIAMLFVTQVAFADDALPRRPEVFEVGGQRGMVYVAPQPAEGKPWVWFAPTIKGISLALRKVYFEGFLREGISIAGFDLGEVRGAPASTAKFTAFYDEMVRRGWSSRPTPLGQSHGGLMLLAWAVWHPKKTRAVVDIYLVCNPVCNCVIPDELSVDSDSQTIPGHGYRQPVEPRRSGITT